MSYDPSTLQPRARERYLGFGRQYTAEQVPAQAHQTLLAYAKYGPLLLPYGFPTDDAQHLGAVTDRLWVQGRPHPGVEHAPGPDHQAQERAPAWAG